MSTIEYAVAGMSCEHCEHAITEEVSAIDGVTGIDVSAATGRLLVTGDDRVQESAIIAAVDEAGYSAVKV